MSIVSQRTVHSLPDELVKEILSDVVVVSDDDFSKETSASPFGRNVVSTSQLLLVSKRWLRIATPLLYECIVLRSSAQTISFNEAMKGKIGVQLKRFVRRMRFEGCFGAIVSKIFGALPQISTLFVKLPSSAGEKVNGFAQGLQLLSPTQVIFEFTSGSLWANSFVMSEAICAAVRYWDNLVTFKLFVGPFILRRGTKDTEIGRLTRLCDALSDAPFLRHVTLLFSEQFRFGSTPSWIAQVVKAIGKNSSLQSLRVYSDSQEVLDKILDDVLEDPCANLVQCSLKSSRLMHEPPNSILPASGRLPHLPDDVLELIIDMYLRSHSALRADYADPSEMMRYRSRALKLFHVSKTFYKIACHFALRFVTVYSPKSLRLISRKLSTDNVLPGLVDTVKFAGPRPYHRPDTDTWTDSDYTTAKGMMESFRNVRQISITSGLASTLDDMTEEAKLGLNYLCLDLTEGTVEQVAIAQFRNLTSLVIKFEHYRYHHDDDLVLNVNKASTRPCFECLLSLKIDDKWDCDAIHVLQSCDFPSVQTIDLVISDLPTRMTEGRDLPSDLFPNFPNLRVIAFRGIVQGVYAQFFQAKDCPVEKIVLCSRDLIRSKLKLENELIAHTFTNIDFSNLRALEELQIKSVTEWPWQDHELKNSAWQRRAQALVDAYGFKITDTAGIPWKPRLMKRTKGRGH